MSHEMDLNTGAARFSRGAADHQLNVIIVYGAREAARYALGLVERLASRFEDELEIQHELWPFDHFDVVRQDDTTQEADLIIVCANPHRDLPPPVKDWLETWASEYAPGSAALIALMSEEPAPNAPFPLTSDYLEAAAKRAGQDFFLATVPSPKAASEVIGREEQPNPKPSHAINHSQPHPSKPQLTFNE